jgi:hypothetical protein
MDSFKEFSIKDTHNHADFAKMYSCYASYVGRQRSNGISTETPDFEKCRTEYDEFLLQGSISVTRTTVGNVVNNAIQIHGAREYLYLWR